MNEKSHIHYYNDITSIEDLHDTYEDESPSAFVTDLNSLFEEEEADDWRAVKRQADTLEATNGLLNDSLASFVKLYAETSSEEEFRRVFTRLVNTLTAK